MPIPWRYDLEHTFYEKDENGEPTAHASRQRFLISNGKGGFIDFETADCIVDNEASKERPAMRALDVVVADAVIHIGAWNFPRRPQAGELIYWNEDRLDVPPTQPYEIMECTKEECAYVLSLYAVKGGIYVHPARNGQS